MRETAPQTLIELKPSKIDMGGVGVFAVWGIKSGRKVADGIEDKDFDHLVPWACLDSYENELRQKIREFCIGTPEGFIPPPDFDFNRLSIDWYFNHSCEGNLGFDDDGDFIAIRDITKGEELTYDYALAESNPEFRMLCTCGSKNCRKIITGNDWKDEQFRIRNREHILPRLKNAIFAAR